MLHVQLDPGLPGGRWACLRAPRGHDEQALTREVGSTAAVELIDRLLLDVPGTTVGPGCAWRLAVSDRDRLLAAIYADNFGDHIESEVPCAACDEASQIDFSLAALVEQTTSTARVGFEALVSGPDTEGVYALDDELRFRIPTSADQLSVLDLAPDRRRVALLQRCIVEVDDAHTRRTASDVPRDALDRVEAAMAAVGPVLDLDLPVSCHACGATRLVRFDIQRFLLAAFAHERRYFVREIHYLACAYGWSLGDILELAREERRAFVRLVVAERSARQPSSRSLT
jgi:hypothetical protein